jgi:sugar/nucleoside kinase (ribokinase family)
VTAGSVVCAGLATRDTILRVAEHPPADGRVVAEERLVAGGGPAATAAVALARLGVAAAFVGAVGDDEAGRFVAEGLAAAGVDVSALAVVPGARTPESVVLVSPGGARAIVHVPGDAPFPALEPAPDAAWLHVDHVGFGHVRRHAPDAAPRVSVDGGNPIPGLDLRGVSLYAPTEATLRAQVGGVEEALAAGAELVVVTRGAAGALAAGRDGSRVEAAGVEVDAVGTLGAGDVFHGALLAWLVRGAPLTEALRAASTAAALSCRALDGRSAIPDLEELERRLA